MQAAESFFGGCWGGGGREVSGGSTAWEDQEGQGVVQTHRNVLHGGTVCVRVVGGW